MDTFEQLEQKISRAVEVIEKLKAEKSNLKTENDVLRRELEEVRGRLKDIESEESQKSEKIKLRLTSIMDKLDTLEEAAV